MTAVAELAESVGTVAACAVLGVPRATVHRKRAPKTKLPKPRATNPRALDAAERQQVLDALHSDRLVDQAPAEAYATLLDEGKHLCSIRTMYRILDAKAEVHERRGQLRRRWRPQTDAASRRGLDQPPEDRDIRHTNQLQHDPHFVTQVSHGH